MLTLLGYFIPNLKDIRYSILAEYSIECVKYYCRMKDGVKALYWSTEASKYLMKRFELRCKKRA